jgi:hypothetical protein
VLKFRKNKVIFGLELQKILMIFSGVLRAGKQNPLASIGPVNQE